MTEIKPGVYKLDPDMTRQWDTLEKWLRTMAHRLWVVSNPHSGLIAGFNFWAYPAAYGYISYQGTRRKVQELATGARDTFFPLIAACTFFILVCQQRQATEPKFDWKWQMSQYGAQEDVSTRKIHATWIHDLMGSFAGDMDAERIGAIFDPTDPTTIPFLRLFKLVNMPMILHWGTIARITEVPYREQTVDESSAGGAQEALVGFGPKEDLMKRLLAEQTRLNGGSETSHPKPLSIPSVAEHPSRSLDIWERVKDVPLCPASGQNPGEHIRDFLERRRVLQDEKEKDESPLSRYMRLQRKREAEGLRAPGKKGPRVWHWEKVHLGEGKEEFFRVRTLLTRGDADARWTTYSPSQKVFDSWNNCWDVCSDLGDDPLFPEHEFDDVDIDHCTSPEERILAVDTNDVLHGDQGPHQTSSMEVKCQLSIAEMEQGELEEGELRDELSPPDPHATNAAIAIVLLTGVPELDHAEVSMELILRPRDIEAIDVKFSQSILSLAFARYGFQDYAVEFETLPEAWSHCRSALGNGYFLDRPASARFAESDPDRVTAERLRGFFGRLYNGETALNASFDLYFPDSAVRLALHKPFQVISRKIGEGVWYEIAEHGERRPMSLIVPDPLTVLQVFRENWGPKLADVVSRMVQNGIEFHLVIPGPPMPTTSCKKVSAPSEPRLGYRPNAYVPDKGDFVAYVSARNQFLRGDRGKIALCQGGILARLAREVVGEESVIDGPDSSIVFSKGRCFFEEDQIGYWGDVLTEAEVDLICGVYYCATQWTTNQRDNKFENIHRSWFPRPNAFNHGSFNIGVWSKDAEKWYKHCIEECQDQFRVMSAARWREGMVLNRHVRKIIMTSQKIAHSFLQARYPLRVVIPPSVMLMEDEGAGSRKFGAQFFVP
ncbi:hypothetical protein PM082_009961 [Marasmius tenuissimus]|nr:hypothetical protein PM082_009961 [Marasmius tenuissimus]